MQMADLAFIWKNMENHERAYLKAREVRLHRPSRRGGGTSMIKNRGCSYVSPHPLRRDTLGLGYPGIGRPWDWDTLLGYPGTMSFSSKELFAYSFFKVTLTTVT